MANLYRGSAVKKIMDLWVLDISKAGHGTRASKTMSLLNERSTQHLQAEPMTCHIAMNMAVSADCS